MTEQTRKNPLCVISVETFGEYGVRSVQTSTAWSENPYSEGYVIVPDDMVQDIMDTRGFCDIELNEDGTEVISFTAREIPVIEETEPEPTANELVDILLGVDEDE